MKLKISILLLLIAGILKAQDSESNKLFCGEIENQNGPSGEFIDFWKELKKSENFILYDDGTVLDIRTNLMWWSKSIKIKNRSTIFRIR